MGESVFDSYPVHSYSNIPAMRPGGKNVGRDLYPQKVPAKTYQPSKWTGWHRRVVILEQAGMKPGELAEFLEVSASTISIVLNDPRADLDRKKFAEKAVEAAGDIQSKLSLHANEALDEIVDEMRNCEDVKVRQKASFGILDRAGFTPVRKQIVAKADLPPDVLKRMESVMDDIEATDVEYEILPTEDPNDPEDLYD